MEARMTRVGLFCLAAGCMAVAACSGTPSMEGLFAATKSPPQKHWILHVKSEPPGAQAKAPQGQSCRTPCELTLPMTDTSVTFALDGYHSQTIPVTWLPATFHYELYERTEETGVEYPTDFSPNPVIAQLVPGPAQSRGKKSKPQPRRPAAAAPGAPVVSAAAAPSPSPR
jgi:hypothetical protein